MIAPVALGTAAAIYNMNNLRTSTGPLQELVWSMSPSAVASADRLTYTKLVYMMKPLNELDTANVFHALTVPISTVRFFVF